jgi:excisionase family DNA binding protein
MKTKKEAAAFLGVSEKAIERYANAGKLKKNVEEKEGGGFITYYDETELEKLKKAMKDKAEQVSAPRQPDTTTALARRSAMPDFIALLTNAIGQTKIVPQVDITEKSFLTIKEAAALSGLSVSHFEFAIKSKKLKSHTIPHVRGRRIKRADLDVYVKKL